jgi:hypothetical protein
MNTNSECVYTVYTYSECVVTVDSSRRAALEARNARGGTRGYRASGVFTENVAVAEILGRLPSDLAGVPLWSKDGRPDAWNGVKC